MNATAPAGMRAHPRLVVAGLALLAIALGCVTVFSPAGAFFGVLGLAALFYALRDPAILIVGTLLVGAVGEPWQVAYVNVSAAGVNLFPADILIGLLLGGWLLALLRSGDVPAMTRRPCDLALGVLLVYGLFALARGLHLHGGAALPVFRQQYAFPLLYFLSLWAFRERAARRRLLGGILLGAAAISLLGLHNAATGHHVGSATSTLSFRYLSGLQALAILFGLALMAGYVWQRRRPLWSLALGVLYLTGILLSQARSVWMGAVIGLFAALSGASSRSRTKLLRYIPVVGIVLVVVVGAIAVNTGLTRDLATRAASITDVSEDVSSMWRLFVWGEALKELQSQPLLGLGLGQRFEYFDVVQEYWETRRQLHNSYLERAYAGGLISVALLILFQVIILFTTLRAARRATGTSREGGLLALICCQVALAAVAFTNVVGASLVSTLYVWVLSAISVLEAEDALRAVNGAEDRG